MATADVEIVDKPTQREPEINKLFRMVMKHEGSDLHLKVGSPPMMRLKGVMRQMEMRPLTQEDMERLVAPIVGKFHREQIEQTGGPDFGHVDGAEGRRSPGH